MPNFRYVVDIGSGLGHLPNSIARRLINDTNGCCSQKDNVSQMESVGNADSNNSFKPVCVIAVECNESMHIKACRSIDKTLQDNGVAELGLQHIERLLFRVEASDLDKLKSEITTAFLRRQRVTDEESVEPSAPPDYLVCGLHCCGDLGPSVIRLFNSHQQARSLLLVGCCYHKMALDTFPMSPLLREAMSQLVQLGTSLITESTFRLACQWSPCSWFTWCARDFNKHRLQFVGRTLLSHLQRHSKKSVITKERKSRRKNPSEIVGIKQLLDNPNLAFAQILPLLLAELCTELELDSEEMLSIIPATELEHLWTLTPGILAIQQLLQPLLEALILADRVWAVRSATGDGCYAGLVRLFEPHVSPRCIALVACRK
ncbi:unnamed protein product [Calicophoron daubneyi]|uniref:Methyltransferase domain-containing protein n=1 Tax=Calicophoron daubneyi TaxID=300641 RepID=A0AAV2TIT0_CALDB